MNKETKESHGAVAGLVQQPVRPGLPVIGCVWGGQVWLVSLRSPTKVELGARLYSEDELNAAVAAALDCRTCAHHTYASGGCVSALRCVGGNRYQPTQPRQLWEQRPPQPAPF